MAGLIRGSIVSKRVTAMLSVLFFINSVMPSPALAQAVMQTIIPASSISAQTGSFVPVHIKALKVRANEPLVFDFVIDSGSTGIQGEALKTETQKLAKYFLAAVTIPESDLWVNLSPYEKDRIISDELGLTEMGRDMLAQDNVLKQMSSAIVNPDTELGKLFWQKVYAKSQEVLGTTEISSDTMQKIWIIPSEAKVYEMNNTALLGESKLKVMLDQDYYALGLKDKPLDAEINPADAVKTREVSLQVMRDLVLPAIEKEVNEGKDFAPLRQLYGAMIFATWYKKALKESLLSQVYADQKKTAGVESNEKSARERIYQEYVAAFKKGAFNFIREDADPATGEIIPRKYFSGGLLMDDMAQKVTVERVDNASKIPLEAQAVMGNLTDVVIMLRNSTPRVDAAQESSATINDLSVGVRGHLPEAVLKSIEALGVQGQLKQKHVQALEVLGDVLEQNKASLATKIILPDGVTIPPAATNPPEKILLLSEALKQWDIPGVNDDKKLAFLEKFLFLHHAYAAGLKEYSKIGAAKLESFVKKENPLKGKLPKLPSMKNFKDFSAPEYISASHKGVEVAAENIYITPAGGEGARLGWKSSIKMDIRLDTVAWRSYLHRMALSIGAAQDRSNTITHAKNPSVPERRSPWVIMTSDTKIGNTINHLLTKEVFEKNNYFGLDGLTEINYISEKADFIDGQLWVVDKVSGEKLSPMKQIVLVKQELVPSMWGTNGAFFVPKSDIYTLDLKGHNHGDIHMLMFASGLSSALRKAGFKRDIFYQDTNGEVFNAIPAAVGSMVLDNKKLNIVAVTMKPGEKVGSLVEVEDRDGNSSVENIEYSDRERFFNDSDVKIYMKKNGVTADQFNAGNLNVYVIDHDEYDEILARKKGNVEEIVNPKEETYISRLEAMNQDMYKEVKGSDVMVSQFDSRFVFAAAKNGMRNMLLALAKDVYSEGIVAATSWHFQNNRAMFKAAGVDVVVAGVERLAFSDNFEVRTDIQGQVEVFAQDGSVVGDQNKAYDATAGVKKVVPLKGVPFVEGAHITYSPNFAVIPSELKERFQGVNKITATSALAILGAGSQGFKFRNFSLDGAAIFRIPAGVELTVDGWSPCNQGWEYVPLAYSVVVKADLPETIAMRGESVTHKETFLVDLTDFPKGKYTIDAQGNLLGRDQKVMKTEQELLVKGLPFVSQKDREVKVVIEMAQNELNGDDAAQNMVDKSEQSVQQGGIDLNAALLNMIVEKSGTGVKVTVDPKLIEQIKTQGVDGFTPVIINMMPVSNVLATMGASAG